MRSGRNVSMGVAPEFGIVSRRLLRMLTNELALASHPEVRAVGGYQTACSMVVSRHKRFAAVPDQKTGSMHRGVGEPPEWIALIRQEIGSYERIIPRVNDMPAECAVSPAGGDSFHP
jgi:hypothetical protein